MLYAHWVQSQTLDGKALPYVLMKPEGFERAAHHPLVILLHGLGASMFDLAGLASAIDATGYLYAFPNAPYRVNLGYGTVGYSWALDRPGVEAPSPGAPPLEELLEAFIADVQQETGAEGGMVLGGFSQGGGLALQFGLPRPERFAGLAVLSGFFRDAEQLRERLPPERRQRIFVAHGIYDHMVGREAGRQTTALLREMGYDPTYHEYDMGHEISAEVLHDLVPWLHETLPRAT